MLRIVISNKQQNNRMDHESGPLEFGRAAGGTTPRCLIQDPFVGRNQLRVEELPGGRLRLENTSHRTAMDLADGSTLVVGAVREVELPERSPIRIKAGETLIEIERPAAAVDGRAAAGDGRELLQTIDAPVHSIGGTKHIATLASLSESPGPERLAQWFETLVAVQRAAAGSAEFYEQTARAVVELIGLDYGLVLLRRDGQWESVARHHTAQGASFEFSQSALQYVFSERRTFYQTAGGGLAAQSLAGVSAVVASPIFDAAGEAVVGAVYGARMGPSSRGAAGIRPLEAQVVQVLAAAVSAGLARQAHEAEATRRHVQFEMFSSPEVARHLDRDPTLLDGRDREITVLFSDIRGFSRLAEGIGASQTFRLAGAVMDLWTSHVLRQRGVVANFVGDGLLAMWNAPEDVADHAAAACRAALGFLADLPHLSREWEPTTGTPIRLGVGINTGSAIVGNTGSKTRVRYGPLGHAVNLASRVEGATKHLGVPILITGPTRDRAGTGFATRRLCRVRAVGIAEAVDLYELIGESVTPQLDSRRRAYEAALELFEAGRWQDVPRALSPLLAGSPESCDVPSLRLVSRAIDCMITPPERFDPVHELESK